MVAMNGLLGMVWYYVPWERAKVVKFTWVFLYCPFSVKRSSSVENCSIRYPRYSATDER